MQRIGLMGGSFNPIHSGHIHLARTALCGGYVDRVLFLPTGNPPHKHDGLADKLHRLAMVELAIAKEADMQASREEIDREGVIYTVDTLTRLSGSMTDCRLVYLIGSDTLRVLHTWRRPEDVIRLCSFLVVMRPGETRQEVDALLAAWRAKGAQMELMPADEMDISSTDVRRMAAQGLSLAHCVPQEVEAYIRRHGLYGSAEDGCR
ncbi:MAG: nicotinate-nucleotide adenylyltransferase [Clostridia bacterium]|nr:nicotinate-nucleotide adenylyltransferase [Clostridia bacterium]